MRRKLGALLPIEFAILDVLRDGPQHAYSDAMRAVGSSHNASKVYRALYRLEEMGLVSAKWERMDPDGRPARRYYECACVCGHPPNAHGRIGEYLQCLECLHSCPDVDAKETGDE